MDSSDSNSLFSLSDNEIGNELSQRLEYLTQGLNELLNKLFDKDFIPETNAYIATLSGSRIFLYKDDEIISLEKIYPQPPVTFEKVRTYEDIREELGTFLNVPLSDIYTQAVYGNPRDFNKHGIVPVIIIITKELDRYMCLKYFYERLCFASEKLFNSIRHRFEVFQTDEIINIGLEFFISKGTNKDASENTPHLPNLHFINKISALTYESKNCDANIAFVLDEVKMSVIFHKTVTLNDENSRQIRKILEMAKDDLCLVVNCIWNKDVIIPRYEIIGLADSSSIKSDIIFKIKGHMQWDLYYVGKPALTYKYGRYMILYDNPFDEDSFKTIVKKALKTTKVNTQRLAKIMSEALKQKDGTTLIITKNALDEADRLCSAKRGIKIGELNLAKKSNMKIIENVTSIDGAIILSECGNCYGIGVILDGEAVIKGSLARGARYNSAINYISLKKRAGERYAAVIISEDKTYDIITTEQSFAYLTK